MPTNEENSEYSKEGTVAKEAKPIVLRNNFMFRKKSIPMEIMKNKVRPTPFCYFQELTFII